MGRSFDALLRAERERGEKPTGDALSSEDLIHWGEDLAALRVSVHALEDRIELELPALHDELRQTLAKAVQAAGEAGSARDRAAEDRLGREIALLRFDVERLTRRVGWAIAAIGAAALFAVARC
jgi:hypothetical protein